MKQDSVDLLTFSYRERADDTPGSMAIADEIAMVVLERLPGGPRRIAGKSSFYSGAGRHGGPLSADTVERIGNRQR